jgi:hypothetical protein
MCGAVLVTRIRRLRRGGLRGMRRHEQIMPKQREDDEESLDPE